MSKKKRSLPVAIVSLILFASVMTSCNVPTQAVEYANVEKQEWLAYVPEELTVTNCRGEEKNVSFGVRKNAVLNTLKSIHLNNPAQPHAVSDGGAYSVILQYSNVRIRYTFHGSEILLAVDDETVRVYTVDPAVLSKVDQQLRDINPS